VPADTAGDRRGWGASVKLHSVLHRSGQNPAWVALHLARHLASRRRCGRSRLRRSHMRRACWITADRPAAPRAASTSASNPAGSVVAMRSSPAAACRA
jgi:hypothetical protein